MRERSDERDFAGGQGGRARGGKLTAGRGSVPATYRVSTAKRPSTSPTSQATAIAAPSAGPAARKKMVTNSSKAPETARFFTSASAAGRNDKARARAFALPASAFG